MKPKQKRILLVDDEEAIFKPLSRLLRAEGYDVTAAKDGYEALDYLNDHCFDLLLIDVMMPGMNGWEFRERQMERYNDSPKIPAIFLSADNYSAQKAVELGEKFIPKPIDLSALKSQIKALLLGQMTTNSYKERS